MVYIDHRKLIGFGKGSFVVTMPKSWVRKHNLKKGDTISIEEGSDELVFYAGEKELKKEEKSISINTEDKKLGMIKAEIVSAYLNNYNTIEIFSKTLEDDAPLIKGILRNLSGMEIIEQTGSRIVAKDLIDVSSISIQNIIRRMDVITRSMIDDTILCIQGKCNPKSILHRDTDVNRLHYLGFRVIKNAMQDPMLTKKLKTNSWELHSDKMVLLRIEEIADRQKRVSRLASEADFKDKILKEFKEMNEDIRERYNNVMKAYYNNDKKIAFEIEVTSKNFIGRCDSLLENISKKLSVEIKKGSEKPTVLSKKNMVPAAKIVDYTKSTITFIKYIARTVLNMD